MPCGSCRKPSLWPCPTRRQCESVTTWDSSRLCGRRCPSERRERRARRRSWTLAVRQIISRAVASEGVMDIFAAAGLDKPDISVLSDEFLAEVQ